LKYRLLPIAVVLLLTATTSAAVEAYAYPMPWDYGDGELILRLETDEELAEAPVFVVVDMTGDEVIRLTGGLTGGTSEDETDLIYEVAWDGRNADGRPVAPGTYVCYVEGVAETAFRFIVTR
jgi:hypothetical protein